MRVLLAYLVLFSSLAAILVAASSATQTEPPSTSEPQRPTLTLIDLDERSVTQLTQGPALGEVSVTADGRWLYFAEAGTDPEDGLRDAAIYRVDLDSPRLQPEEVILGAFPVVSPDGTALAHSKLDGDRLELAVQLQDGREVTLQPPGLSPAWSPDGHWLAYRGEYREEHHSIDFYLVDRTTWESRLVAQARVCNCDASYRPIWAANSRYFLYPFALDGVGLVAVDGSALPAIENAFAWSADGSRLFWFESNGAGSGQTYTFYVYDFTRGQSTQLAVTSQNVYPSASPRGDRFVIANLGGSRTNLIDTRTGAVVSDHGHRAVQAWSPDGAYFSARSGYEDECGPGFAVYEAAAGDLVRCLPDVAEMVWTPMSGTYVFKKVAEPQPDEEIGDLWMASVGSERQQKVATDVPLGCLDYLTWIPGRSMFVLPSQCGI